MDGAKTHDWGNPSFAPVGWNVAGSGDFDADGKSDVLWRHGSTGEVYVWLMDGKRIRSHGSLVRRTDSRWTISGVADFDGDGRADILWRDARTLANAIYFMKGLGIREITSVDMRWLTPLSMAWAVVGTPDLDHDGKADVLWRNQSSGEIFAHFMDGALAQASGPMPAVADLRWRVTGTGNLDGEGGDDILWRHCSTSCVDGVWFMEGSIVRSFAFLTPGDPDLEHGFPIEIHEEASAGAGGSSSWPTVVGDIDGQPGLEILVPQSGGGIHAWHHDGTAVAGWPEPFELTGRGRHHLALGKLSTGVPGLQVFSAGGGIADKDLFAFTGRGQLLPGWPRWSKHALPNEANVGHPYLMVCPALGDVDGDGIDEIFVEEFLSDYWLGYKADGSMLPGWPRPPGRYSGGRNVPAIGDLDGDGKPEIVTWDGVHVFAFRADGSLLPGFPIWAFGGLTDTSPVIGDVNGDGSPEIVVAGWEGYVIVQVFSASGKRLWADESSRYVAYGASLALADLDGDGVPEIVAQSDGAIDAWKGNGQMMPNFPILFDEDPYGAILTGNSAPVIGDVDGDQRPDIVVSTRYNDGYKNDGAIRIFSVSGVEHPRSPKTIPSGRGAVPAIADLDLDGRNEIIASGDTWRGQSGPYEKVWVFDLGGPPHGKIEWGQFGGGPRHQNTYGAEIAP